MSVITLVTLLEAFFNIFWWTHRYEGIALPLLRTRVGVTTCCSVTRVCSTPQ